MFGQQENKAIGVLHFFAQALLLINAAKYLLTPENIQILTDIIKEIKSKKYDNALTLLNKLGGYDQLIHLAQLSGLFAVAKFTTSVCKM